MSQDTGPLPEKDIQGFSECGSSSLATVSPSPLLGRTCPTSHPLCFPDTPQLLTTPCLCLPCSFSLEGATTYPHPQNGQEHFNP